MGSDDEPRVQSRPTWSECFHQWAERLLWGSSVIFDRQRVRFTGLPGRQGWVASNGPRSKTVTRATSFPALSPSDLRQGRAFPPDAQAVGSRGASAAAPPVPELQRQLDTFAEYYNHRAPPPCDRPHPRLQAYGGAAQSSAARRAPRPPATTASDATTLSEAGR